MDAETRTLFESRLLSLAKARAREGRLPEATHTGAVKNPFCGDEIAVDVKLSAQGAVVDLGYEAKACSLCVASAELLSDWIDQVYSQAQSQEGGSPAPLQPEDLHALAQAIDDVLKGGNAPAPDGFEALVSVAPFRARHKCVTLPFDAAIKALEDKQT
ncbi:MAG: hypothetical protein CME01_09385 [Geminicoccus sp.]|nr:hypothetical protein [Geminicoccus sp.]